jgi:hypothetical protein
MMPEKKRKNFLEIQALAGEPGKAVSKNRRMSSVWRVVPVLARASGRLRPERCTGGILGGFRDTESLQFQIDRNVLDIARSRTGLVRQGGHPGAHGITSDAPSFASIAHKKDIIRKTHGLPHRSHPKMPDMNLTRSEIADITT